MDFLPPFTRQLIVASSPQLAALSVGGLTGYPAVLVNQLKRNESSIETDVDTMSWIASIHGIAGIPSIIIPTLMQWRGRRFAFITSCLSILVGWIFTYFATNAATILIGESFHGFGGNSLIAVSLITISEMVDPKFRSTSMILFGFSQTIGVVLVTLAGYFLHWQTVSIVMGMPTLVALLLVFIWPESPYWLACKGEFEKCEKAFISLRGTGEEAIKELNQLTIAQKKSLRQLRTSTRKSNLRSILVKLSGRDFYVPNIHVCLIMFTYYFSGPLVVLTYAVDIIADITKESDFICFIFIDVIFVLGGILSIILMRYFDNKPIMITSLLGAAIFLILASVISFCKYLDIFPKQTLLFCVLGYMFCCIFGGAVLTFNISAELIPVKHRGLGGALYVIESCLFHSGSIKISPYMFESIGFSGTLLFFSFIGLSGVLLHWFCIPETKGRTLQEIEDYYNVGSFVASNRINNDSEQCAIALETKNDD